MWNLLPEQQPERAKPAAIIITNRLLMAKTCSLRSARIDQITNLAMVNFSFQVEPGAVRAFLSPNRNRLQN